MKFFDEPQKKALPILAIIVTYVAVQLFAITGPYFTMDDAQELSHVNSFDSWWRVLGADAFQLFRPVKNLIFSFFALFPEDMTPLCRVSAIVIGCISFFPVLALFHRVFANERQALLAAAIWLLAPTLVSSAAWLSCVNIQIMCALGASAIALHDKAFEGEGFRPSFAMVAAACLFLACASYEQAVAIGPIVVIFDFYLRPERFKSKNALLVYVFYALVTVLYLLLRGKVGSVSSLNGSFDNVNRLDIIIASAYFTCWHFFVWLWPFGNMSPTGSYSAGDVSTLVLGGCWVIVLAFGVLSLALRRRNPLLAMGIAFAFIGFLPVSNILGFGNGPYGDYYMGLPSLGLSITIVAVCGCLWSMNGRLRIVGFSLFAILSITRIFAVLEAARWAWLWADGTRAFKSGIQAFPQTFANRQLYARICYESGRLEEVKECCNWLESHLSSDSEQLAIVYDIQALVALNFEHNANVAMECLDNALRVDVKGALCRVTRFYRGCVYEDLLADDKSAEVEYRAAIAGTWTVDTPAAADRLARLLAIQGKLDEAEVLWEKAVRYRPDDASILYNLIQVRNVKAEKK